MNKEIKKVAILSSILLFLGSSISSASTNNNIININNNSNINAVFLNNSYYVPIRKFFESEGYEVNYLECTKEIFISKSKNIYVLSMEEPVIYKNFKKENLDDKLINYNNSIHISLNSLCKFFKYSNKYNTEKNKLKITEISTNSTENENWKNNIFKINLDTLNYEGNGNGIKINNKKIYISKGGIYELTGELINGNININTTENVELVLNNVKITNSISSSIIANKIKNLHITLKEGSKNFLNDTSNKVNNEVATIFSNDDIKFDGTGYLKISSSNKNSIYSKGKISIKNSNIELDSSKDGINAKNGINISKCTLNINSFEDAIQSDKYISIDSSNINIKTSGTITTDEVKQITTGTSKGIKAETLLVILDGEFNITSTDHAIKSNGLTIINGGNININSNKKGIKTDGNLFINGGNINITNSFEGIESSKNITINGGDININSLDDAINTSGGIAYKDFDSPVMQEDKILRHIYINNGNISITSAGDGIDSNGFLYINNGTINIENNNPNSKDVTLEAEKIYSISGGKVIAVDSHAALKNLDYYSPQSILRLIFGDKMKNSKIVLKNSNNEEIFNVTPKYEFKTIIFSSKDLEKGKAYELYINDKKIKDIKFHSNYNETNLNLEIY